MGGGLPRAGSSRESGRPITVGAAIDPIAGSRKLGSRHQIDLQVGKEFTVAAARVKLIGKVINVLDREHPTAVCEFVTGCGGFELGEALAWQQPRRYELGVRLEF